MDAHPAPLQPWKLPPGEVHVWSFRLDLEAKVLARLAGWLSVDEWERCHRLVEAHDQQRFIARRGLLRRLLAGYLDASPESLQFTAGEHGRPALAAAPGLGFNAAHSGGLGLLAVAAVAQIGVDVERLRPEVDPLATAGRFFSPAEQAQLRSLPAGQRLPAFFLGWTRKEAYLKALGVGLANGLDQFDVSLAPDEPAQLLAVRGGLPAGFHLVNLEIDPGYAGAVCLPAGEWQVRLWKL